MDHLEHRQVLLPHGPALRPDAMIREELQLRYDDSAVRPAQGISGFIPYRH
jgi:hypothetical protein